MSDETPSNRTGTPELIEDACDALSLPDEVSATATVLYRRVYDDDLYHGRSLETVLAGTVYIACRVEGYARNPSQIAEEIGIERDDLLSTARHLMKRLHIKLQPIDPEPHVRDFADALNLSDEARDIALDIIAATRDAEMHSGKSPTGFAAGAVYAATTLTDDTVTQKDVQKVSDVSTVTIRNRYKKQLDCYENATRK